jgi:hypothetical protein
MPSGGIVDQIADIDGRTDPAQCQMGPERSILRAETGGIGRIVRYLRQVLETTDLPTQTDPENGCLRRSGKRSQPRELEWEWLTEVATGEGMDKTLVGHLLDATQESERDMPILGRDHPTRQIERGETIVKSHPDLARERDGSEDPV